MKLKACSLFLGYREYNASIKKAKKSKEAKLRYILNVKDLGEIDANEYVRHGFRVIEAQPTELEALIAGGYENKRLRLRFYQTQRS